MIVLISSICGSLAEDAKKDSPGAQKKRGISHGIGDLSHGIGGLDFGGHGFDLGHGLDIGHGIGNMC